MKVTTMNLTDQQREMLTAKGVKEIPGRRKEPTDDEIADLSLRFVRIEPLSDFDYVGFARAVLARYR
jgi:hypothetical protein